MEKVGRNYFDNVENPKNSPTTWEYIVKAEHLKQLSFAHFDKNGGCCEYCAVVVLWKSERHMIPVASDQLAYKGSWVCFVSYGRLPFDRMSRKANFKMPFIYLIASYLHSIRPIVRKTVAAGQEMLF